MPATTRMAIAASSQRSTVHHQLARAVRCARETMGRDLTPGRPGTPPRDHCRERLTMPFTAPRLADLLTRSRNAVPALLEIGELVEGRAGRRQQHDLVLPRVRGRLRGRRRPPLRGDVERAAHLEGHGVDEGRREGRRRLADQIGARDTRPNSGRSGSIPPSLARPPTIQCTLREGRQCLLRCIRIGRLRIVDEQHAAAAPDLFHAVGEAGELAQRRLQL